MFKFDSENMAKIVVLAPDEKVVEFTPNGIETEKVLSLSASGRVLNATSADGFVEILGRVNFKFVYEVDGAPKGADYNADFSVRLEGEVSAGDAVFATVDVEETDVSSSLKLSAVVKVGATVVKREECEMLVDGEDCFKTTTDTEIISFVSSKIASIQIEDEVTAGNVESVLSVDTACIVKSATAKENAVDLDLIAYATVLYVEDGKIKSATYEIEENEEVSVDGVMENDIVIATATADNGKVVLAGNTDENIIRFENTVNVEIRVFRTTKKQVVDDMFMLTNEIETESVDMLFDCPSTPQSFDEKVSGEIDLETPSTEIAGVFAPKVFIAKAQNDDGKAVVEGIVVADVLFSNDDGMTSVRAEVPFSIAVGDGFDGEIKAYAIVNRISARLKRDDLLDIAANVTIVVKETCKKNAKYISAVTVGAEKEVNKSGMSLYIASGGEEAWDIAKALTATPENILRQNPAIAYPLQKGEKVLYFRNI